MTRVLVLSEDPVGPEMGGNAIRAYELAAVLSEHAQVALASPAGDLAPPEVRAVRFEREDPRALRAALHGTDVVLALPPNPVVAAELRRSGARVVYDLYDPRPLQVLEAFADSGALRRRYWSQVALDHTLAALASGDFLLCASERQRDLWIGAMLGAGLISAERYGADPSLARSIAVVPFGVPAQPPSALGGGPRERFPALGADAEIVLWNGGLWNWLDPLSAVEAIARVVERRPQARLVFMGRAPLDARQAASAGAARERAQRLGLLERVVLFNDEWVSYARRADWLLACDCALSLHVDHLETRYAFRTRLLDCFWAGLPVVCTEGDELAERVRGQGLGAAVPAGDPAVAAEAIVTVLERGRSAYADVLAHAACESRWSVAAAALVDYVRELPPRRPSAGSGGSAMRGARAVGTRAVRGVARAARRIRTDPK
jgi:glycosyltransferase involved in cell wall biosynthesis